MKCYNKECNKYEEGRDDTNCIALFRFEVEKCFNFMNEEDYRQVYGWEEPIKEVCEWDTPPMGLVPFIKCINDYATQWESGFKHCPYCGKPIKIKDHV